MPNSKANKLLMLNVTEPSLNWSFERGFVDVNWGRTLKKQKKVAQAFGQTEQFSQNQEASESPLGGRDMIVIHL